jgi:hypothetical protein
VGSVHNSAARQVDKTEAPDVMDTVRELHAERLRDELEYIKVIREKNITALDTEFEVWKEKVQQSLTVLFGKDHGCTNRFCELVFWLKRAGCGGEIYWSRIDKGIFNKDLLKAEEIISDALIEL